MKKVLVAVFVAFMTLVSPAFAASLDVEINPSYKETLQWDFAVLSMGVKNSLDRKESFLITIDGPHLEWKMPGDFFVVVGPGETRYSKIIFLPAMKGDYVYTLRVTSFSHPDIRLEKTFTVSVKERPMGIRNLRAEAAGSDLKVTFDAVSTDQETAKAKMEVVGADGTIAFSAERPVDADGVSSVTEVLPLKGLQAGQYTVRVSMGKDTLEARFSLAPLSRVTSTSVVTTGSLYDEVVITVVNDGNIVEDYTLRQDMPSGTMTGFVTKPQRCVNTESGKECEFVVKDLGIGETRQVTYRIEHWPTYAQYAAGILVVALLGVFSVAEVSKPKINKKVMRGGKGKNHHTVMLEIKNPLKEIDSVIVRDFVSPLARVPEMFEHLAPIVRRSEAGTELIWKIGKMKPREVRVLSYRMKPLVGGQLKMPRAYLRYRGNKGERIRVASAHLTV